MDREYLINKNKSIREKRPLTNNDKKYSIYENNGTLQICFKSKGCNYFLNGFCIMCDYGKGINISKEELELAFDEAISRAKHPIRTLLLNSYGSVLDTSEISEECFASLLNKIKKVDIKNIIFETHYTTINRSKLLLIKSELADKNIMFELGLESSNSNIRSNNLLKMIDNDAFVKKIDLIHSFGMQVLTNIIIGTPFLSTKEQLDDSLKSVLWCFENGVDEVDLFPINVKPYTILKDLYDSNEYQVISHWLVIELLNQIPVKYLNKVYLAWYGNRELEYENGEHSILPKSCPKCHQNIMDFYTKFLSNNDNIYRKRLIDNLISNSVCNCYDKLLRSLTFESDNNIKIKNNKRR